MCEVWSAPDTTDLAHRPGAQPHWFGEGAPQIDPKSHMPQSSGVPHRSENAPHTGPAAAQVVGTQHTLGSAPAPHIVGSLHVPQSTTVQPLYLGPHSAARSWHVGARQGPGQR